MSISSTYQKAKFVLSSLQTNTVYLALFTQDPGMGNNFADELPASMGYARQSMGPTGSGGAGSGKAWLDIDGQGTTFNGVNVIFPAKSTAGTITVTHFAICDASARATGNKLFVAPLDVPKQLSQNDVIGVLAGGIGIKF